MVQVVIELGEEKEKYETTMKMCGMLQKGCADLFLSRMRVNMGNVFKFQLCDSNTAFVFQVSVIREYII